MSTESTPTHDNSHWLNEIKSLKQLRDEIQLKAHLLRADLRDEWQELEERWQKLEQDTQPVRDAVGSSAKDIGEATAALVESVGRGLRRIRDALKA